MTKYILLGLIPIALLTVSYVIDKINEYHDEG